VITKRFADVNGVRMEAVTRYGEWLAGSRVPKLFVNAAPGSIPTRPR
jgi:hypothetical protein